MVLSADFKSVDDEGRSGSIPPERRTIKGGVGPPATTSNRFPPGNGVTRSTFSPSPFPLFDFQVRVAAAERGCVSEIRKKIRKNKIQNHLGKARRPTVYQRKLLRSYPAFSGSGLPVEQASSSQLWTPNAPLSTNPLTTTVFVQLTPLTHFFHFYHF